MDGAAGWDDYAPFYDWENSRTIGRRDLPFWQRFAAADKTGRGSLELGCGTGRILVPLARTGRRMTGVDLSAEMLERARQRAKRMPAHARPRLVRGDMRALPFAASAFARVLAPYGVLQSLTSDADFDAVLTEAARVLASRGRLGIELVPDLQRWDAYQRQARFHGRLRGANVTLVESVRQDRDRGLTVFDEEFVIRSGARVRRHRFSLAFRTLAMATVLDKLTTAGFTVEAVRGSYGRAPWTPAAPVWMVIARR